MEDELAKAYRICLLSILDYCSTVYHTLVTDEQDQALERLQATALKFIYGYETPYSLMREKAQVTTLRQRRVDAADKLAQKCPGQGRFSAWFPLKPTARQTTARSGETFLEEHARCN